MRAKSTSPFLFGSHSLRVFGCRLRNRSGGLFFSLYGRGCRRDEAGFLGPNSPFVGGWLSGRRRGLWWRGIRIWGLNGKGSDLERRALRGKGWSFHGSGR